MFGVTHIDIGNDIDDPAVGLFRQTFVKTPVPRFHMEDRDMQALCTDDAQTAVGIAKHQDSVRPDFDHQLVRLFNDVADRGAEVITDRFQIMIRLSQTQIFEKDAVEFIVIEPSVNSCNDCADISSLYPSLEATVAPQKPATLIRSKLV